MDEFDYLDGTLADWTAEFYRPLHFEPDSQELLDLIQDEYIPRFEAAIHKLHSTNSSAWNHPYIERLPFGVVYDDPEDREDTFRTEHVKRAAAEHVERVQNG